MALLKFFLFLFLVAALAVPTTLRLASLEDKVKKLDLDNCESCMEDCCAVRCARHRQIPTRYCAIGCASFATRADSCAVLRGTLVHWSPLHAVSAEEGGWPSCDAQLQIHRVWRRLSSILLKSPGATWATNRGAYTEWKIVYGCGK